jgi:hypothetical protein
MKKKLPKLQTNEEAEELVVNANLAEFDLSVFRTVYCANSSPKPSA